MNIIEAIAYCVIWIFQAAGWTILKLGQLTFLVYKHLRAGPKVAEKAPTPVVVPAPKLEEQATSQAQEAPKVMPMALAPSASVSAPKPISDGSTRVDKGELFGPGRILLGYMWVYLYDSARVARRVFKVADPYLMTALKRERFFFPDVPFDPALGSKPIMDGLYKECKRLVDPHQKRVVEQRARKKADQASAKVAPKAVPETAQPVAPRSPAVNPAATPTEPVAVVPASARAVKGQVYAGVVTQAGMTGRVGTEGAYRTYCLTIHDGTREIPLFGSELQRQASDAQIKPGERVKVVFMGEEHFKGRDGKPMHKNLYQISRMGAS